MDVVEHTALCGVLSRASFMEEWYRATGWTVPNELSLANYWFRQGGYTKQAG